MRLMAWCGACGGSFALSEVVDGAVGRCPRCGDPLAPEYTAVLGVTVHQLLTAADALDGAIRQLKAVAPSLHLDLQRLCADLDAAAES